MNDWRYRIDRSVQVTPSLGRLVRRMPQLSVLLAGNILPFEMGGRLGEYEFYFRAEWSHASLKVAYQMWQPGRYIPELTDAYQAPLYMVATEDDVPDPFELGTPELDSVFCRLVQALERSPRWWEFAAEGGENRGRWGHTPEEAWALLHEPSDYLIEKGISTEQQLAHLEGLGLNPQTITIDERVWPDEDPVFEILDPSDVLVASDPQS